MVAFLAEDVLFLQCIPFSQCLYDVAQYLGKLEVQLGIIAEARHGILDFKNDGTVTLLRPKDGIEKPSFLVHDVLKLGEQSVKRSFLGTHTLCFNDCTSSDRRRSLGHDAWHGVRCVA